MAVAADFNICLDNTGRADISTRTYDGITADHRIGADENTCCDICACFDYRSRVNPRRKFRSGIQEPCRFRVSKVGIVRDQTRRGTGRRIRLSQHHCAGAGSLQIVLIAFIGIECKVAGVCIMQARDIGYPVGRVASKFRVNCCGNFSQGRRHENCKPSFSSFNVFPRIIFFLQLINDKL